MKQHDSFTNHFFRFVLLIMLVLFVFHPVTIFANDSVFDWMEDEESDEGENVHKEDNSILQEEEKKEDEVVDAGPPVGLTAGNYIRMFFALAFVVGLLYAILKFINRRNRLYEKNHLMRNIGGLSLGQQKSIQLIVVGDTYYLVGVGEDIRLLKEITDPEEITTLLAYYEEADEIPFQGNLEKILTKISPFQKKERQKTDDKNEDFSQLLNHRLTEIKEERKKQFHRLTEKERNEDD